jgi:BMFP domain-containing protein YqiC
MGADAYEIRRARAEAEELRSRLVELERKLERYDDEEPPEEPP